MMRRMAVLSIGAVFLVCASALFAEDRLVPSVYPTIQAAIDDCNTGDVVIVEPNTYTGTGNRDIDFLGKAITVRSIDPNDPDIVAATVIDCDGTEAEPHRGFNFHSGEDGNSVLNGLKIVNGHALWHWDPNVLGFSWYPGGAVFCEDGSPTIANCVFSANTAQWGGAIASWSGCPTIVNCTFVGNSASVSFYWYIQ